MGVMELRRAIAENDAHYKIINWNQLQKYGDFQSASDWEIILNYGTVTVNNGVLTWTCDTQPTQFYHTGFRTKNSAGFLSVPYNDKILVYSYVRCSVETRVRIYGLVGANGNTYIYGYMYSNVNVPANEWVKIAGFISDRPQIPPATADDTIIKRFKPVMMGKNGDISTITVGTTMEVKDFMAFDLTQMFGAGNEPSTVDEFEHICAINNINLTTYQAYDEGTNRWFIVP